MFLSTKFDRMEVKKVTIDELPEVLVVKHIQKFLGIGRPQSYQLVNSNAFPVRKVGGRILIPKKTFLEWFFSRSKDED